MNENLTDDELKRLKEARSESEWNAICDEVNAARGGEYPRDWYTRVVLSGLLADIASRFAD